MESASKNNQSKKNFKKIYQIYYSIRNKVIFIDITEYIARETPKTYVITPFIKRVLHKDIFNSAQSCTSRLGYISFRCWVDDEHILIEKIEEIKEMVQKQISENLILANTMFDTFYSVTPEYNKNKLTDEEIAKEIKRFG